MQAPWQKLGFLLKLGLRPRQESCWLPRESLFGNDSERDEQISQKQHLFAHNYADIFAAFPSASSACTETLQMVCNHITLHHHAPTLDIDHTQHPLEAAARLVPEDLLRGAKPSLTQIQMCPRVGFGMVTAALGLSLLYNNFRCIITQSIN